MDQVYKNSPYESFGSNPIIYSDPSGLDSIKFNKHTTITTPNSSRFSGGGQKSSSSTSFGISTVPKDGPDIYVYNNSTTTINEKGESSTTTSTTILHPEDPESAAGVTRGLDLYFDGLITAGRNNKDWESVGKLMNLDKSFNDYMIARNPSAVNWRSRAMTMEAMEGVLPVLVRSGLGVWAGFRLGATMDGFTVNSSKFDYFFGRVVTGSQHNIERSAQNLKDLTTLGIADESQLTGIFRQAFKNGTTVSTQTSQYGTTVSTQTSQYGTTVMKSINVGNQGSINVGFFYQGGNMSATPSVSTAIPKIFK